MKRALTLAIALVLLAGCSLKKMAVDTAAEALADGGGVYARDEDPDLVREALPFGLKTFEGLLEVSPENENLLLATASGFAGYAYLLRQEADLLDATDLDGARHLRERASKLFLRGRDFARRGLALRHPAIVESLAGDLEKALAAADIEDVPFLYWAGVSWAGALAADKSNLDLLAELPRAGALVRRVLDLDDGYDSGAAHEFFVSYEGGRPGGSGAEARKHYERALELSGGRRASIHLALAEAVALPSQNLGEFRSLLARALAIDPDEAPDLRLFNTLAHRRARWLESRIPDLFVLAGENPEAAQTE